MKLMDELERLCYREANRCNTLLFTQSRQLVIEERIDYYAILANIKRHLKGITPAAHRNPTRGSTFSSGVVHLFSVAHPAHFPAEITTQRDRNGALVAGRVHPPASG